MSPWRGTFVLRRADGTGGVRAIRLVDDAGVGPMDAGAGRIVCEATSVAHPSRLVMIDRDGSERVLHDPNPWVAERELSLPAEHWLEREDGTRVQYWVMPPSVVGEEPRKTVLAIHGGPHAMWGPGEATMWHEFQVLCARGYGIVYANPRGSGGYGYDFKRANERDWGEGPSGDVLACLDDAVSRYDWIDEDRLVVTGGSYAGYLTAWVVAHDHRFKAALAQRGVYDLETFFGEGNAWMLVPWAMGGYPWEPEAMAVLDRESPFTYVDQITTPLLIMHASNDLRTGVSQSEMLYRALKVLGREVEYVRYPGAGHDLSRTGDPGQRMDRLCRIVEWFERFVGDGRE
jgi:dipeptidyl aminopeptidase/acylaminoacyl peptidase